MDLIQKGMRTYEVKLAKMCLEELKKVNKHSQVLTRKSDDGGINTVFLLAVEHGTAQSIAEASYLANRFSPKHLFLELDEDRYNKIIEKEDRNSEFQSAYRVSKSLNSDLEVISGDIHTYEIMLIQRKVYMERLKKFPFSNPSHQYQMACQVAISDVRNICLFNKLWNCAEGKQFVLALTGAAHVSEIVHLWNLRRYGNMAATVKYQEILKYCEAAKSNKGASFLEALNGPDISSDLRPFPPKFGKQYLKKSGPFIF